MRNRSLIQSETPEAREREYWRTIVRNVLSESCAASDLRKSAIEVLSWKIAKAIQDDLKQTL